MIGGIIFKNMACIEYSLGKHHFLTDWSQFYEGKEVSKKCGVASEEYFYKNIWEILQLEIKKIPIGLSFFPRVSIILPVYQGEKTVRTAIKSPNLLYKSRLITSCKLIFLEAILLYYIFLNSFRR